MKQKTLSMLMMNNWSSLSEEGMVKLGESFAAALHEKMVIGLIGPLGAGKTTFIRGALKKLGVQGRVKSPSYTLIEPYELEDGTVLHCDFYRLNSPEELEYLALRDESSSAKYCFIEWPEKGTGYAPALDLIINFSLAGEEHTLSFEALTERGKRLILSL